MNKPNFILDRIGRLTRTIRLKRHLSAIADAVKAMPHAELVQFRAAVDSAVSVNDMPSVSSDGRPERDRIIDALNELAVDRQLNSDSAIVRVRYAAKWLTQAVRLTVGSDDAEVREIHRSAVTILRSANVASGAPARQDAWFIGNNKRAS
jgi:hypothetical protein